MGLSLLEGASPPAAGWVLLAEGIQYETVRLCQVSHKHRSSLSQSLSCRGLQPRHRTPFCSFFIRVKLASVYGR